MKYRLFNHKGYEFSFNKFLKNIEQQTFIFNSVLIHEIFIYPSLKEARLIQRVWNARRPPGHNKLKIVHKDN